MAWFRKRSPVSDPSARARFRAQTAELAVVGVQQLMNEQPPGDAAAIRLECSDLQRHWNGPGLVSGSLSEVCDLLEVNLEHDVARRGTTLFMLITATSPNFSVQVASMNARYQTTVAHRVWSAGDVWFLYSSRADALTPATGGHAP